jgi:hypothetical protein
MAETLTERPAAVQAGVDAFLEQHREELRQIHRLDQDAQEEKLSGLMSAEIERIAKMGQQDPQRELAVSILIALETDRVLALDSPRQQKVIAVKYGLDPKAIISHYPELQTKAAQLQKTLIAADKNTSVMGWTAFAATAAGLLIPFGDTKKSVGHRFGSGNKLLKWFFVSLASLATGFGSSFIGGRIFAQKTQEQSKDLVTESRIALEREVTDAITSRVHEDIAAVTSSISASPAPGFTAATERKAPRQPREGFVAEAAKEKVTTPAAGAGIG